MGATASQITSLIIEYTTVYSGAGPRKHQSSASLAFVGEIHRWPVNSPHKWPVTRKMFSIWWRHHELGWASLPSLWGREPHHWHNVAAYFWQEWGSRQEAPSCHRAGTNQTEASCHLRHQHRLELSRTLERLFWVETVGNHTSELEMSVEKREVQVVTKLIVFRTQRNKFTFSIIYFSILRWHP